MAHKNTSWDTVASWYDGWVGKKGSHYHRKVAIPTVLELLELKANEKVLEIGSGTSVLAPYILAKKATYTGVELSPRLIALAKRYHGALSIIQADARMFDKHVSLKKQKFDAAVFLLSIQDMEPLDDILKATYSSLHSGARLVIFMIHPCFRVPRQSGWGYDKRRKLNYRRIDSYLKPLRVPMKQIGPGTTYSFHRPMGDYLNTLTATGFRLELLRELADQPMPGKEQQNNPNIPLFLALRAVKP